MNRRTAIVGGGAAGFFLAVNLKEMVPDMEVDLLERNARVLRKVEISGGGRCNCTNSFRGLSDLSQAYPRGHRLLKRLFNVFSPKDAYEWFERRGVPLTIQDDECVFPQSQDSHSIINLLLHETRRLGVNIRTEHPVTQISDVAGYDFVAVTTGGQPSMGGLQWLADAGHQIEPPMPSLFSFRIDDQRLHTMKGTVANHAAVMLPGSKLHASGPLLITHWGMSGPAILKLSSYGARLLAERNYQMPLSINWTGQTESEVQQAVAECTIVHRLKQVGTICPCMLTSRLWAYLAERALAERATLRWCELGKKDMNRLVNTLCNDTYQIAGRAPFRDEFVTCGGVSLKSVNPTTLESRVRPGLYFAGEVLDIDGITGGFNFQAAWTTAFVVAQSIMKQTEKTD